MRLACLDLIAESSVVNCSMREGVPFSLLVSWATIFSEMRTQFYAFEITGGWTIPDVVR